MATTIWNIMRTAAQELDIKDYKSVPEQQCTRTMPRTNLRKVLLFVADILDLLRSI